MSYVSQQFLLCDNSSTANFKNWGQAISSALSSSGWTQTTDTGQVNWSTVSVPASGVFVYEIWQPGDALQTGATAYYVKINYGTSSGSPAGPRLQIQIGTGTDGSGNLTGITSTNFESSATNNPGKGSILTYPSYFSGDTTRFHMILWMWVGAVPGPSMYSIERTYNTDGTQSSDGVSIVMAGNNGTVTNRGQQTVAFGLGAAQQSAASSYIQLSDFNNASGSFNGTIPVSPCFPQYGKYGSPMTGVAFVHTQDVAEQCLFTATLYGATRTYMATGNAVVAQPSNALTKLCMRFD